MVVLAGHCAFRCDAHNEIIRAFQFLNAPGTNKRAERMTTCRIVLTGMLSILTCLGRAAEPLKIGMVASLTGPLAESGLYETQGAKLAAEEVNETGGVLGRPIVLIIEDDQTTNPGSVLAFSRLAEDKDVSAFIGPIHSTQIRAMAPDIQRVGKPMMIGGADPQLTHMGNPWLFRCRPNDTYSARVIVDYGINTLGKKKWAIVHSTDAYGTSGVKNLVEVLKRTGLEPVLIQGYTNNSQDLTPVALAVRQSGADVMQVSWLFFKARAKRRYLNHNGRASDTEKQPTGRGPEDCVENGPAAALLVGYVSIQVCALLAPCRRPILNPTICQLHMRRCTSTGALAQGLFNNRTAGAPEGRSFQAQ
jgi:Periplasmic binding protein